ncbi:hypothetical protein [Roseomonas sp. KE0001]|nr:hypothetical protein [Roseomonas sp. KE0001]
MSIEQAAGHASNLSRQPEKVMALDFLARASQVRRGTVRRFQHR